MKKIRVLAVAAIAAASIGITAAPASACPPDDQVQCCSESNANQLWRKLTGNDLYHCW